MSSRYKKFINKTDIIEKIEKGEMRNYKRVKVFYIFSSNEDEAGIFLVNLLSNKHLEYNNIYYHMGFWLGINGDAKIAILHKFKSKDLPYKHFEILVSKLYTFLNVKGGSYVNLYKRIYFIGKTHPNKIYSKVQDFNFSDHVHILDFNQLKNNPNYENILCLNNIEA